MIKLLLCILASVTVAVTILQLRQQRLNAGYEINKLYDQIEASQARLWNQQIQIAVYTAPNAISQTINHHDLKMAPLQQRR